MDARDDSWDVGEVTPGMITISQNRNASAQLPSVYFIYSSTQLPSVDVVLGYPNVAIV